MIKKTSWDKLINKGFLKFIVGCLIRPAHPFPPQGGGSDQKHNSMEGFLIFSNVSTLEEAVESTQPRKEHKTIACPIIGGRLGKFKRGYSGSSGHGDKL